MNNAARLDALDRAGATLAALGEERVTLTCQKVGDKFEFTVGVKSPASKYSADFFAHSDTPRAAFVRACDDRSAKANELAIRARIQAEVEDRVRAELEIRDIAA